jgi:hypothetical protein
MRRRSTPSQTLCTSSRSHLHADSSARTLAGTVEAAFLDLNVVPPGDEAASLLIVLRYMFEQSSKTSLVENQKRAESLNFEDIGMLHAELGKLPYNVSKARLANLTEAIGRPSIKLETCINLNDADAAMEWGMRCSLSTST